MVTRNICEMKSGHVRQIFFQIKDTVYAIAFSTASHFGELFSMTPEAPWIETCR